MKGVSASTVLDDIYQEAGNKAEIDYWEPFAKLIMESLEARQGAAMSQQELAEKMNTRQSVISRFENMGRIPSYDFIARMAIALGHVPGMTLYGEYMAVVSPKDQRFIAAQATLTNKTTQRFTQELLENAIAGKQNIVMDYNASGTQDNPTDVVKNKVLSFYSAA